MRLPWNAFLWNNEKSSFIGTDFKEAWGGNKKLPNR